MEYPVNPKSIYGILLFLFIWLLLIFAAPVLYSIPDPVFKNISVMIYTFFKPTCHQLPSRSLQVCGHALAVCVRCLAFYSAGLVISIVYLFIRRIRLYSLFCYALLILPLLIDFILEKVTLYHNNPALRFGTGGMAGAALFQLVLLAMSEKKTV
jgi:uncharacterized membrane protein